MKMYTNKSNAARAAKKANNGTLDGLVLHQDGEMFVYRPAAKPEPAAKAPAKPKAAPAKPAKAKPAPKSQVAAQLAAEADAEAPKAPAKKAPAKKAAQVRKPATPPEAPADAYDPVHGATQGRIRGYSIDTDRQERHGMRRRSAGTIGGRLWAIYDEFSKAAGGAEKVEIAKVKEDARIKEFNANKVVIEFYCWRKWNGVRGRGKKQKVDSHA